MSKKRKTAAEKSKRRKYGMAAAAAAASAYGARHRRLISGVSKAWRQAQRKRGVWHIGMAAIRHGEKHGMAAAYQWHQHLISGAEWRWRHGIGGGVRKAISSAAMAAAKMK
jgi:hypothetical protein